MKYYSTDRMKYNKKIWHSSWLALTSHWFYLLYLSMHSCSKNSHKCGGEVLSLALYWQCVRHVQLFPAAQAYAAALRLHPSILFVSSVCQACLLFDRPEKKEGTNARCHIHSPPLPNDQTTTEGEIWKKKQRMRIFCLSTLVHVCRILFCHIAW